MSTVQYVGYFAVTAFHDQSGPNTLFTQHVGCERGYINGNGDEYKMYLLP